MDSTIGMPCLGLFATGNSVYVDAMLMVQSLWRVQLHDSCMKAAMREVLLDNLAGPSLLPAALAGPDGRATATVVSIGDADTIRVIEGGPSDSRCAWPA